MWGLALATSGNTVWCLRRSNPCLGICRALWCCRFSSSGKSTVPDMPHPRSEFSRSGVKSSSYPHLRTRVFDGVDLILTCVPAVQAPYPPPPTPTTLLVADGKLLPLWRLPTARNLTHPTMKHTFFVCPGTASCLHHGPHDHHPLLYHPDEKIHCYNASLKLPSSRKMLSSRGWEHTSCHHDGPAVIPALTDVSIDLCMCMHQLFMIARR